MKKYELFELAKTPWEGAYARLMFNRDGAISNRISCYIKDEEDEADYKEEHRERYETTFQKPWQKESFPEKKCTCGCAAVYGKYTSIHAEHCDLITGRKD